MAVQKRIESWLRSALALWSDAGQCPETGGFHECLTLDGDVCAGLSRRVRVQFRQIYVFSHAYELGLDPLGLDRARRGFDYVLAHAWAADGRPGWAHLLSADGAAIDPRRDAYDHVFALFGLAWYFRVSRDPRAQLLIRETLTVLEETLRAENGGFIESDLGCWPRRQNPHMHAIEAMMALFEATGEYGYLARAGEQYALFSTHFFDSKNAYLLEYFDTDWRPLKLEEGQRVEPGHMAEWVWLLREYQRLTGRPLDAQVDPMFEKLLEIGFEDSGRFLIDELTVAGHVASPTRRLWPQTELLKSALAQHRARPCPLKRRLAERTVEAIFDDYLSAAPRGGWLDKFDADGRPVADRMPASTFYHLFNAFAATLDVLGAATETQPCKAPRSDEREPRARALNGALSA